MATRRSSWRPWSDHPIIASVTALAAVAAVIIAIVSLGKTQATSVEIVGRIIDDTTQIPISGAKVSFDMKNTPPIVYSDTEGVFRFIILLDEDSVAGKIIVQKEGFANYDRLIDIQETTRTIEDIRIKPISSTPPALESGAIATATNLPQQVISDSVIDVHSTSSCTNGGAYAPIYDDSFNGEIFNNQPFDESMLDEADKVCWSRVINIDIVGKSDDGWVKLAPYLVLDVIANNERNVTGIDNSFDLHGGIADYPDEFFAYLDEKAMGIMAAPLYPGFSASADSEKTKQSDELNRVGYFSLAKSELEVFSLSVHAFYNREITFKVGVVYSYKGKQNIHWIPEEFTVEGTTTTLKRWDGLFMTFEGEIEVDMNESNELLTNFIKRSKNISHEYPAFPLTN
ncbi:hypothetical protein [Herpetosiphon geysericola]|uniref:Carboxypeptidase regulatory-like domain-containing protein n=1 Tax=Herpetosiphon geysericola TaxID=70996 RepID=A0A0P6Y1S3_9CHLR|nr:hypothetical protein [Herpetosiphon geysericola]KPL83036.1 hypothetical protein SE18_19530 [Herpetosiphon geysericola]